MSDDQAKPDYPPLPPPKLEQPRHNGNHQFMRPRNQDLRDAWAADRATIDNWFLKDIAASLDVSESNAHYSVERGIRARLAANNEAAEPARAIQRTRLERAQQAAMDVLEARHVTVSHGKVITVYDSEADKEMPLLDDGPILQAVDRLVRISESLRRLDGLDAPTRTESTVTVAPQDAELQERLRIARERVAEQERRLVAGEGDEA